MHEVRRVEEDLQYVKESLRRWGAHEDQAWVLALWGILILVGFSLVDFAPLAAGIFWVFVVPVGGIGTWVVCKRRAERAGERDRKEGRRHALHWAGLGVFLLISNFLFISGHLQYEGGGQLVLLLVAFAYYLAGVHLDRMWMPAGLIMAAGVVALAFTQTYAWTLIGVTVCIALVGGAVLKRRRHV